MFVGHYGASFAANRVDRTIPLWVLFLAVQFLDVLWAPCILLGIEKVRIHSGITASNPLDLYYMPYTHSLVAALLWSCMGGLAYHVELTRRLAGQSSAHLPYVVEPQVVLKSRHSTPQTLVSFNDVSITFQKR